MIIFVPKTRNTAQTTPDINLYIFNSRMIFYPEAER